MDFRYAALTDVGRIRIGNEDAIRVEPAHGVAILADGMGGYAGGEVASAMAIQQVGDGLTAWLARVGQASVQDARNIMEACVAHANRAIFDAAHSRPEHAGMGTTLVVSWVVQDTMLIGHVGDSRAYLWRQGALRQLTRDHSVVQEQIDAGLLTPDDAARSANHHLVTRALGVEDAVSLEVQALALQADDLVLLCSDGLTDMVCDEELAELLRPPQPLPQLLARLIACANHNGGRDNVSVVAIEARKSRKKSSVLHKLLGK